MLRQIAVVLAVVTALSSSAVAAADPVVPNEGASCASDPLDTMTWLPDAAAPLVCTGNGNRWTEVDQPYPVSDRWASFGPAVQLHGQGRRNPSMLSGQWTATPTSPESHCRAVQVAIIAGTPTVGPPRIDDGAPGETLSFEVVPTMSTIEISGACLWQKVVP